MVKQLQAENIANPDQTHRTVSGLYYAGDQGSILCHIVPPNKQQALLSPSLMFECPVRGRSQRPLSTIRSIK
jgi:hypothetical protein